MTRRRSYQRTRAQVARTIRFAMKRRAERQRQVEEFTTTTGNVYKVQND